MRPPTIYLAGPINGATDEEANGWRQDFMARLPRCGFLDPMDRDYRGREDECNEEIVEGDKRDIEDCDVFLAYHWKTSDGTSQEILHAYNVRERRGGNGNRPVCLVVIPEGQRISPWVRYHSTAIVPTLEDAALWIEKNCIR